MGSFSDFGINGHGNPTGRSYSEDVYYGPTPLQRVNNKTEILQSLYGKGDMKHYEALEAQAQRLLMYAEEERRKTERFGEDDYPDGAVITFEKMFPGGTVLYKYAAIKCVHGEGSRFNTGLHLWYTTGPKAPKGYTWEELINWMGEGVQEIYYVTNLERVV